MYLHTAPDKAITVTASRLPREKTLLRQANKTTSKSGHKRRSGTFCWGRNLDHMAWLTNYKSNFCTWRKIIAILQRTEFYHILWRKRKQVYRLPNIPIEARNSLHFLKDCKKTGEVEIVLFTLLTVAFPWYFGIADSLFLLCLHNHLMYIMPYHWNIKQMCGCLNQLNTKSGLTL